MALVHYETTAIILLLVIHKYLVPISDFIVLLPDIEGGNKVTALKCRIPNCRDQRRAEQVTSSFLQQIHGVGEVALDE